MFHAISRFFAALFCVSQASVKYDINHLHVDNRRAWTSPRSAGSQLLEILSADKAFLKHLQRMGAVHTLVRMAVVDSELRVCTYRCSTDPLDPSSLFDESWIDSGIFHYLFDGKTIELQIRDSHPQLKYDRSQPEQCFTYPLVAEEISSMMSNWRPAAV